MEFKQPSSQVDRDANIVRCPECDEVTSLSNADKFEGRLFLDCGHSVPIQRDDGKAPR